jgi:hypothetical protein
MANEHVLTSKPEYRQLYKDVLFLESRAIAASPEHIVTSSSISLVVFELGYVREQSGNTKLSNAKLRIAE